MTKKRIPTSIPGITKPYWAESYMTVAELLKILEKVPPDALLDWDNCSARGIYGAEIIKIARHPVVMFKTCTAGW